jgi:hypothetical protein
MRWSTSLFILPLAVGFLFEIPAAVGQTTPAVNTSAVSGSPTMTVAPPGTYPPPGSGAHTLSFLSQGVSSGYHCVCNSCVGSFIKNALKPICALLGGGIAGPPGGLIPVNPAAGGAGSTAAAIQADQAGAKARRDAVRYLGTVDCHYYPEAESALICALRTDRSECVRLEAGFALSHGCCCTKATIEALRICVSGSDKDGNPGETSPRVRIAAFNALQGCCQRGNESPEKEMLPRPEPAVAEGEEGDDAIKLSPYYSEIDKRSMRELLRAAEMTLGQVRAVSGVEAEKVPPTTQVAGNGSLMGLWARANLTPQSADPNRVLNPIAQPTLAAENTFASPGAQNSPSVIYTANRDLPATRLLPPGELLRLPDPNAAESFAPPAVIPDSSLPQGRAKLY